MLRLLAALVSVVSFSPVHATEATDSTERCLNIPGAAAPDASR